MKNIKIVGMPMKFGCYVEGADLSYDALKDLFNEDKTVIDTNVNVDVKDELNKKIKFADTVMSIAKKHYNENLKILQNGNTPITIGGDHSSAIGSVSAAVDYTQSDLSVIWFDAHFDIHNDLTTPSGNVHGMPLSICIGRCQDKIFDIGNYRLKPENIYYIGVRSYEKEELDYVKKAGITYYTDKDVENMGIINIIKEIKNKIKTNNVHLSFDLDVMSSKAFPAVNVEINKTYTNDGGLDFETTKEGLESLLKNLNIISMDMVEYNPLLDDGKCKNQIKELVNIIKK